MKKYISIMLITLAVAGSSCKKTYLSELALNPDRPGVTTPNLQLTSALTQTASYTSGSTNARYLCWDNYYSYSTNYQPSTALLLYSITTSSYDSFTPLYQNIANYNAILGLTAEPYYQAIAHIMIAYDFQQLVDQYGNVPYTQALQGINGLTPAYDTGTSIYDDLLKQLDNAITLIQGASATAATPGKYDVMFGATNAAGMTKWAQFANTLKLRLAVRQSGNGTVAGAGEGAVWTAKSAALTAAITKTAAVGYLTTSVEAAINPGYYNTDSFQPPVDVGYGYKANGSGTSNGVVYQANTYFLNTLVGNGTQANPNDPRLPQIYAYSTSASAAGTYQTTPLGGVTPPSVAGKTVKASIFSSYMISPTKSSIIMSGSEAFFLQAELARIGVIAGGPAAEQTFYNAGISASFVEDGLTAAAATTYTNTYAPYPLAGTAAQKTQAIITQKWIALNPYEPLEAYCEILRTGYPAVPLSILSGVTATGYVTRMLYPASEYNYNAANVNAQGTITIYTKLFWQD